jgi:F-type H+-transporting ATPase subunit epsilon
MATFHLSIVTPEETVFDETVTSIIVPGAKGYLGVLAHHAPLISPLVPGKLSVELPDGTELIMAISGGFIEVANNRATILADAAEMADTIDRKRAVDALERARKRLLDAAHGDRAWDIERATAALRRAKNRLHVLDATLVADRS